jgi:hypothetical protein
MRASASIIDPQTAAGRSGAGLVAFAIAIFLSAFLLFLVQPIIGRYILPWFGGNPGVWTTCLMFFQVMLLGGYAYAHLSIQLLRPRAQVVVHLLLLGAAVGLLPIIPAERWKPLASDEPTWRIMSLLLLCLGLPYFVLSATGPLLQAWVARLNGGKAPYRLYALSNAGSLLALGAYPFAIEPLLTRRQQALGWSWGLGAFACICALCTLAVWKHTHCGQDAAPHPDAQEDGRRPGRFTWLMWVLLPACASVLLLATNNVMCREIAAAPFLWVLPLGLYLLSFIICFDSPRWYFRPVFLPALAAAVGGVLWVLFSQKLGILLQVSIYCGALFVCCMVCHGELVRLKPPAKSLTAFYLAIAAGGAIGGIFVAVVAPLIFRGYWELNLGLFACMVLALIAIMSQRGSFFRGRVGLPIWMSLATAACVGGCFLYRYTFGKIRDEQRIYQVRSFYGVLSIYEYEGPPGSSGPLYRALHNGGIVHGLQYLDPERRRLPLSYYGPHSGFARAMDQLRADRPRRIGVVGLGTGAIATWGRWGDSIRYYEIDEQVEALARKYFTYLADSPARCTVVIGDARLSLERELAAGAAQRVDLLTLDAFSGDAIPMHLLTREAFEIYLGHLNDAGILAVHITNRHVDLYPPMCELARHFGLRMVRYSTESQDGEYSSDWLLMSRRALDTAGAVPEPIGAPAKGFPLWTDEHASLLPIMKWKLDR